MNTITITIERIPSTAEPAVEPTSDLIRAILRGVGLNVTKVEYSNIRIDAIQHFRSLRKPKSVA